MDQNFPHVMEQWPALAVVLSTIFYLLKQARAERKTDRESYMGFLDNQNTRSEKAQGEVTKSLERVATQLGENEKILAKIEARVTPGR